MKKILNWLAISVLYIFSPSRAIYSNVDFLLVDLFKIEFTAFHVFVIPFLHDWNVLE